MIVLLGTITGQLALFLGAAAATGLLLRKTARRLARAKRDDKTVASLSDSAASPFSLHAGSAELARWEIQMHEQARDMQAELDSKMRVLQILIDQARREADRLEELLAASASPRSPLAADGCSSGLNDRQRSLFLLDEIPADAVSSSSKRVCVGDVHRLANEGKSVSQIAEGLGQPLDEVELVLSMRP